jgi:hypothetical protein
MDPAQGEQRCHGTCNVGRQPTLTEAQAWEIAGRPATRTESCHHQPPSRIPLPSFASTAQLQQIAPFIHDSVRALLMTANGLEDINLDVSPDARGVFRATATDWELRNSGILHSLRGSATPIVDESSTVVAYFSMESNVGVHHLRLLDLDGNVLDHQTQEDPLESDILGNELFATIVTLGSSLVLRAVARVVLARAAAMLGEVATEVVVASARGISVQAERSVLLFLRSIRAQKIVAAFERRGLKVIVNIGGEANPSGELTEFGEHIALNNQVRMGIAKRFVPNLVKESGENIARVFKSETVDRVVSRKLDASFDADKVARGAFKVLKPGGDVNMGIFTNNPEFGARFVKALQDAGFKKVTNVRNAFFTAVK